MQRERQTTVQSFSHPPPHSWDPSHLLLAPKQHQSSIKQGEAPNVPDRHIRCRGLRNLWGRRLWFWLQLWLWAEDEVLGTWESFPLPQAPLSIYQAPLGVLS